MTETIKKEEVQMFHDFCDEILNSPNLYNEVCEYYTKQDVSFECLFLFQRVNISAGNGIKALLKTVKEIKSELRAIRANEQKLQQSVLVGTLDHAPGRLLYHQA